MRIELLDKKYEDKYDNFLLNHSETLFYVSNNYRKFLKSFLKEDDYYFLALNSKNDIVGALPSFLKRNEKYGPVLNSLPFYGSNGGILAINDDEKIKKQLLDKFYDYAKKNNCISTTIITSPLEKNINFYKKNTVFSFIEERIGQLTEFPVQTKYLENNLMKIYEQRTRTSIRKAKKNGVICLSEFSETKLEFLSQIHCENITALGGIAKPKRFFDLIPKHFEYDNDYKIYTAYKDNIPIAAMLVFYFNDTVEEISQGIVKEFRNIQPLSLLIYQAMYDAIEKGYKRWNFGGTWNTQDGVYLFKRSWGAKNNPYYYFTKIFNNKILNLTKETILNEYPYFFVVPFDALRI